MALADDIRACTLCPLYERQEPGAQAVPPFPGALYQVGGVGVLCDVPRYYEAQEGKSLVGKDGKLFDQLAEEAGLPRATLFLDNLVRHKAPGNRLRDYPEAVANCAHWTALSMAQYNPKVLVLMGATALKQIFGNEATVTGTRGSFAALPAKHEWGARVVIATFHPAAARYNGGRGSEIANYIVQDLKAAKRAAELLEGVML